jgi:hypothetical protein
MSVRGAFREFNSESKNSTKRNNYHAFLILFGFKCAHTVTGRNVHSDDRKSIYMSRRCLTEIMKDISKMP